VILLPLIGIALIYRWALWILFVLTYLSDLELYIYIGAM
jgi:hypothetical protein